MPRMHARVVTIEAKSGQVESVLKVFREGVIPAAKKQRGFGGGQALADHSHNRVILITVWQTVSDLEANEASGFFREQIAEFQPYIETAPLREQYELAWNTVDR
jgi:quinol monooxygenase YgiN